MKIDADIWLLRESQGAQVPVGASHGGGDGVERGPRLALELDLDRQRPRVARLPQDLEHAAEVDGAVPARRKVPVALAAGRVLQVNVCQVGGDLRKILDGLVAGVELDV